MPDNFINDDMIEKLIRFADGECNDAEKNEIEQLLQYNTALRERYENILSAKTAIKSLGLKQRIAKLQTEFLNEQTQSKTKAIAPVNTFRIFMRVAAILIVMAGGYAAYQYAAISDESVFEKNYTGYMLPITRGSNSQTTIDSLYSAGNFTAVQKHFITTANKTPQDYFLAAASYLQTGNASAAITNFKTLQQLNNTATEKYFVQETEYYLALAYIRNGNIDEAQELLQIIKNNSLHIYYNNAKAISDLQLKMLRWKK